MKRALLTAWLLMVTGCGYLPQLPFMGDDAPPPEPTLAELQPAARIGQPELMPELSIQALADNYRKVLAVAEDPEIQLQVRRRLVDLELLASEARDSGTDSAPVSYAAVIDGYRSLLQQYPDAREKDQLLYQMARAYDMDGRSAESVALMEQLSREHPGSMHYAEAEFRKGESYFSAGDYRRAEQAYQHVLQTGGATDYHASSLYMLGWSRFKQGLNPGATAAFLGALDSLMGARSALDALPRGDREMASDCFRVLAVIFDAQGGSEAISATSAGGPARSYESLMYLSLAELYLEQERYQDSATTLAGYVEANPDSPGAHEFHWRMIGVYEAGGFPDAVVAAKASYVSVYAVGGDYWGLAGSAQRSAMRPRLQQYTDELARHHHALAQAGEGEEARQQYLVAADYYTLYVDSFPRDARAPEMALLMAESRQAGGQYRQAIADYRWVVSRFPGHPRAAEAAYAGILAYAGLQPLSVDDRDALIASQREFAREFPEDERAPAVLAQAVTGLLQVGNYAAASLAASDLVQWQPAPGPAVLLPAWLQLGQAEYELARYTRAEQALTSALDIMPADDSRYPVTVEQLAASIYRQGEQAAARGKHLAAADQFARVVSLTPDSEVRLSAQFDAANSYRLAGDLEQANALLLDFRQRFPGHELANGVGALLVENYEASGDWRSAAVELDRIRMASADHQVQREALYLAADYYQRGGDREMAIERYRSYAHSWPEPMAPRLEAMLTLADLYGEQQLQKRFYWLGAIATAHEQAGPEATERSRFLAADGMTEIADAHYADFVAVTLDHPLSASLKRKREVMGQCISAYERVNSYGLQAYGTRATYRLGQVYRQLAADLLASERPSGLDDLALEQYELLLEEQAWPFEEKAIAIFETNARRAWDGLFDQWIESSFIALGELLPVRWGKRENRLAMSREIR